MRQTEEGPARPPTALGGRRGFLAQAILVLAGLMASAFGSGAPAAAQDPGLAIELNKTDDTDAGCVASFVLQNNLGAPLDRFNLDLILFDREGVITRRVVIDLAPLRDGKTRVAMFRLHEGPCADLGRILVNDIPLCRARGGEELDCLSGLALSSRARIALVK